MENGVPLRSVDRYDGQVVWIRRHGAYYELGSYLGSGAAGVVYEAVNLKTNQNVAVKILNPLGFKLTPSGAVQRYLVAMEGTPLEPEVVAGKRPMHFRHIWWLVHPTSKEVIAAFMDSRYSKLREIPLPRCIEIWGWCMDPNYKPPAHGVDVRLKGTHAGLTVRVREFEIQIPSISRKFLKFVTSRRSIFGEIGSMSKVNGHQNCLKLEEVLEMVHDSKSTIFLVLELAMGGELFDRIQVDRGTDAETAKHYFRQLLFGLAHCHSHGVCHRDLKPENLLLADNSDNSLLKIADFGLSTLFRNGIFDGTSEYRRLKSVVGSPHYVAPEVLGSEGYDGALADIWSAGVILYAMLAGNLPFGKEILQCPRFTKWKQWTRHQRTKVKASVKLKKTPYPSWFFPAHFTSQTKSLLAALLEPDANRRMSVLNALRHPWLSDPKTEQQLLSLQGHSQKSQKPEPPSLKPPHPPSTIGTLTPIIVADEQEQSAQNLTTSADQPLTAALPANATEPNSVPGLSRSTANAIEPPCPGNANDDILKVNKRIKTLIFSSPPLAPRNNLDDIDDLDDFSLDGLPALDLSRTSVVSARASMPSDDLSLELPPKFQDLVKRSTRFSTRVPAAEVMAKIADIIGKDEYPFPYPCHQIRQRVKVDLKAYRLDVTRAGVLVCTVQLFLLYTGLYMVEFTRGQLEIFQFKRFYDGVRGKLSQIVKKDFNTTIRQLDTLPFRTRFKRHSSS